MKTFYASGGDIWARKKRGIPHSSVDKYPAGVWGREAPTTKM